MKIASWKVFVTVGLVSLLVAGCGETMLPYKSISYSLKESTWQVDWADSAKAKPLPSNEISVARDGIGTILIRDGLRHCGGNSPAFELLTRIPIKDFSAIAGAGYLVCIINTATQHNWCFDLSQTCRVDLVADLRADMILVYKDPGYRPMES